MYSKFILISYQVKVVSVYIVDVKNHVLYFSMFKEIIRRGLQDLFFSLFKKIQFTLYLKNAGRFLTFRLLLSL